jgi:flagellar capping protein FliD
MATDTDPLGERVANIERTAEQLDERVDALGNRMDERFNTIERQADRLDGKLDGARREFWNWLVLGILALSAVVAASALFF